MFIGPPASAIDAMGSKTRARELMQAAGVPIVPGTVEAVADARGRREDRRRRDRLPGRGQGGGRRRRQGLSRRAEARGAAGRLRGRRARGREVLLRRDRLPRALPAQPAPRRGPGARRRARQHDPPRRARLLDPAPPPEAHRGVAGAGVDRRRGAARADRQDRRRGGARGRLPRRRHRRGPAGRSDEHERVLLPGDEHPRAGRALRDGDDDRDRHRQGGHPRRRGRGAGVHAGRRRPARPRDRVPHQRRGRVEEVRARARAGSAPTSSPAGRACGSTPACAPAARSRRCTTRWWPSSSSGTATASRPPRGCCARSPSTRSRASRR